MNSDNIYFISINAVTKYVFPEGVFPIPSIPFLPFLFSPSFPSPLFHPPRIGPSNPAKGFWGALFALLSGGEEGVHLQPPDNGYWLRVFPRSLRRMLMLREDSGQRIFTFDESATVIRFVCTN